jgi:O-antigen/teichoic acid export membrane protein
MSVARSLALNTGVQMAGKIVSTIIGVIIVGLMTRHLGQEGFGMYSTANAFLQFFAIMLDLGLNVMVVQLLGENAGNKAYEDRAVSATFTLRALSALVLLGIAPIIGLAFPYPWELKIAIFALWASFFTSLKDARRCDWRSRGTRRAFGGRLGRWRAQLGPSPDRLVRFARQHYQLYREFPGCAPPRFV